MRPLFNTESLQIIQHPRSYLVTLPILLTSQVFNGFILKDWDGPCQKLDSVITEPFYLDLNMPEDPPAAQFWLNSNFFFIEHILALYV